MKKTIEENTLLAQSAATVGVIEYKNGLVPEPDVLAAKELHITTATELKHHINCAIVGLSDSNKVIQVIDRLSYLFGVWQGVLTWGACDGR